MPNLRNIKRRIESVKSTQKITRAMKMVAASKLRRAQEAITRTRPYSLEMRRLISSLAARADRDLHPLLRSAGEGGKIGLVIISADRGLCGSFNASIINRGLHELRTTFAGRDVDVTMVGRKGIEAFRRRRIPMRATFTGLGDEGALRTATRIIDELVADYLRGETNAVYVLYNEFKSAISQKVTLERLLPITPEPYEGPQPLDYLYEPSTEAVFEGLLVENLHIQLHRILHESAGSEFGARMTAMDSATKNAGDVIERLTLQYNRARQDAITKELIEVISGAEAL
jgi:F-type H+-transporting ATPase subunit gamma